MWRISQFVTIALFVALAMVIASGTVMALPTSTGACSSCHGTISFSPSNYSVQENAGHATITIKRSGGTNNFGILGVTVTTSDGSATAGSDYTAVSTAVSLSASSGSSATVDITIKDDTVFEGNETVKLTLSSPTVATTGSFPSLVVPGTYKADAAMVGSPGTLTIVEDDPYLPPTAMISSSNTTITAGQSVNFQGVSSGNASPTYLWTFGAGGPPNSIQQNPGDVPFPTAGTYVVNFTVTDSFLASATATRTITVNPLLRTLTVASTNPISGVGIMVSPNDNSNLGSGPTPFVPRIYNNGVQVTLTASSTAPNGNPFSGWSGCDTTSGVGGVTCNVKMTADKLVTAAYGFLISINDVTAKEGQDAVFTVTLSPARTQTVTVRYSTANGTAIAGSDYVPQSNVLLTFSPLQTTKTISITVTGDTTPEPNKNFFVNLSSATNAIISRAQGVGRIMNDHNVPMPPADFDGDGNADIVVYRDGTWWISRSSDGGLVTKVFGGASQDIPVPADYDGDKKTDTAVYRDGTWWISRSSDGGLVTKVWGGAPQDIPVPADYDGDGKTDTAVYRDGTWWISRSSDGGFVTKVFGGAPQDIP
jgi:hypothetical protein